MNLIFGVNSSYPSDLRLTNGFYLHDWVTRKRSIPSFWGRHIFGNGKISRQEISFLHDRNCKIAPMYNEITEKDVISSDGMTNALKALIAAREIGIPAYAGKVIFAVIEPDWQVWDKWIEGFAKVIFNNGYIPGFMANTDSSQNFSFDRSYGRFYNSFRNSRGFESLIWATEPKTDCPECWKPFAPSVIQPNNIAIWQNGLNSITFREINASENIINHKNILDHLW